MSNKSPRRDKPRSLRTILIEPFKQIKFGLYMVSISLVFCLLLSAFFINSFLEQYQNVMEIFEIANPGKKWDVIQNDIFYSNAIRMGILVAGYFALVFFVVFRLTHRYYGPLVSIERFIDRIIDGDYKARVSIRNKDELQSLVAKLNTLAEILEKRHPKG